MPSLIFFDRGLVDAAAALEHATGRSILHVFVNERYNQRVCLTPPWPEIYVSDADRKHGFQEAAAEYNRLLIAYKSLEYEVVVLPKIGIADRADFILESLKSD